MKYLIKHTKELIITIGVFVSVALVVLWAIYAIINNTLSYENIVALIGVIFEMLGWYYNMPTSEENCISTGEMRQKKAEKKDDYIGDFFFIDEGGEENE